MSAVTAVPLEVVVDDLREQLKRARELQAGAEAQAASFLAEKTRIEEATFYEWLNSHDREEKVLDRAEELASEGQQEACGFAFDAGRAWLADDLLFDQVFNQRQDAEAKVIRLDEELSAAHARIREVELESLRRETAAVDEARAETQAARKDNERLRVLLQTLEWTRDGECPACGNDITDKSHKPGCALAAALAPPEPKEVGNG